MTLVAFSIPQSYTQSVGLLGWGINPMQDGYLKTSQNKNKINTCRNPCHDRDSNLRPPCLSEKKKAVHALDRDATVIGTFEQSYG
jgi:hypothetical protein